MEGPEFELLAEIVSEHDRRLDEAETPDAKEAAWLAIVNGIIPAKVLAHVAFQRGIRAVGITTRSEIAAQATRVTQVSSAWLDGFTAGAAYQEKRLVATNLDELHGEALREDWARRTVAAAGKSWATHLAKFDGTVLPR